MDYECRICGRRREEASEYCSYHSKADANLRDAFERWRQALEMDWPTFLREVAENPATGDWVKEAAEYLIREGAS